MNLQPTEHRSSVQRILTVRSRVSCALWLVALMDHMGLSRSGLQTIGQAQVSVKGGVVNLDVVFGGFPELETRRLRLRELRSGDAESLFAVLGDEEVTKFYDDEVLGDISQAGEQIEAWAAGFRARRCVRWGIARRENGTVIGTCGYYGFHSWHRRAGIGYELARPFWQQGIMTEALGAIIEFGFRSIGLNRIEAVVMPENEGSVRLLEGLGFCQEGVLREYENWGDKGCVDLMMFSLLRDEYEGG